MKTETNATRFTIMLEGSYLDCYGPNYEDIQWTERRKEAFWMTQEQALNRLPTIAKYFPKAEVVRSKYAKG